MDGEINWNNFLHIPIWNTRGEVRWGSVCVSKILQMKIRKISCFVFNWSVVISNWSQAFWPREHVDQQYVLTIIKALPPVLAHVIWCPCCPTPPLPQPVPHPPIFILLPSCLCFYSRANCCFFPLRLKISWLHVGGGDVPPLLFDVVMNPLCCPSSGKILSLQPFWAT